MAYPPQFSEKKIYPRILELDKIDVLVDERDTSRHIIITDMPQSIPQGKS